MQLVEVEWIDAASTDINWTLIPDVEASTYTMLSVGYILKNTNDTISLVQNIQKEEENRVISHVINIPKCCILKTVMLDPEITVT